MENSRDMEKTILRPGCEVATGLGQWGKPLTLRAVYILAGPRVCLLQDARRPGLLHVIQEGGRGPFDT